MKKGLFVFLILLILPGVSADIISVNSGGDSQIVILSHPDVEGFFFGEVPQTTAVSSSGGGSSGGGGGGGANEFDVSTNLIKITLNQGEVKTLPLTIINKLKKFTEITIEPSDEIKNFVSFSENPVPLLSNESRNIDINFFAQTDETIGAHIGKIKLKGKNTEKSINVIIEIKENKPLFDLAVELEKEIYNSGETVTATLEAINFGELKNIDMLVYYSIRDFEGNVLTFQEGSYAIENSRTQLVGRLKIPQGTLPGQYVFYVRISYGDVTAIGSQPFTVGGRSSLSLGLKFIYIVASIVTFCIFLALIIIYIKSRKKNYS